MSFNVELLNGEELLGALSYSPGGHSKPFQIAVSTHAVFLQGKKWFAVHDPYYAERIPLQKILQVRIGRPKPYWLYALAALMIIGGLATTGAMLWPLLHGQSGTISGYPPAVAIVGAVIPFLAVRRFALYVTMQHKVYLWKPPLAVDKTSRGELDLFLTQLVEVFQHARLNTKDDRPSPSGEFSWSLNIPFAALPEGDGSNPKTIKTCGHCGGHLQISRWDDWNGFLYRCPHCTHVQGRSWNAFAVTFGSIIFNILIFFVTMRPRRALAFFAGFAAFDSLAMLADSKFKLNDTLEYFLLGIGLLGPFVINSAILLWHQLKLNTTKSVIARAEHDS